MSERGDGEFAKAVYDGAGKGRVEYVGGIVV